MNVKARWVQVDRRSLCLKCLVSGVNGCNKPHYSILHDENVTQFVQKRRAVYTRPPFPIRREMCRKPINAGGRKSCIFALNPRPISVSDCSNYQSQWCGDRTLAFLENGSEVILIDERVAKRLQTKGPTEQLYLEWTNDATRVEQYKGH